MTVARHIIYLGKRNPLSEKIKANAPVSGWEFKPASNIEVIRQMLEASNGVSVVLLASEPDDHFDRTRALSSLQSGFPVFTITSYSDEAHLRATEAGAYAAFSRAVPIGELMSVVRHSMHQQKKAN